MRGRAGEHASALARRGRRQVGLEQLERDAERELALELAAARAQHRHPALPARARSRARAAASCRSRRRPPAARRGPRRRPRRRSSRRARSAHGSAPAEPPRGRAACSARAELAGRLVPGCRAGWAPRRAHAAPAYRLTRAFVGDDRQVGRVPALAWMARRVSSSPHWAELYRQPAHRATRELASAAPRCGRAAWTYLHQSGDPPADPDRAAGSRGHLRSTPFQHEHRLRNLRPRSLGREGARHGGPPLPPQPVCFTRRDAIRRAADAAVPVSR